MERLIYVDNNATTKVAPEIVDEILPYFSEKYFNPSSAYPQAKEALDAIKRSKTIIQEHFGGIDSSEIIFTSCATESNNTSLFGAAKANPTRRHVITTSVEHPAVLEVAKEMKRNGFEVTFLKVDRNGNLDIGEFIKSIRKDTLIISIMHANNETGVLFGVDELSRIAKETNPEIIFHTDATQTVGKLKINLLKEYKHIDLLSFSGHKLHAPKGIGCLFIRKRTKLRPFMIGGHQENSRRAGTENVPYIVALGKAIELAENSFSDEKRIESYRNKLEDFVIKNIPYSEINGKNSPRLSNTSNMSIHYIEGEAMLYQLSEKGICASSGSACTSGSLEPSHVLKAMNVPSTAIHGSIRFSFSRYNNEKDVNTIIDTFPKVVENLRKISPYWDIKKNAPR